MNSAVFKGAGEMSGGEYDQVAVEGVCQCTGEIKAKTIKIDGVFTSSGSIEADQMQCDGVATVKADVRAKKLTVDGVLSVKNGTKIESDEITCDGVISIDGEISADRINADGYISAKEIVGDEITILSRTNKLVQLFRKWKHSKVDLIEATAVNLRGVTAKEVNGKKITIGPRCIIESVDCSGALSIDPSARVGKITGDYTRK